VSVCAIGFWKKKEKRKKKKTELLNVLMKLLGDCLVLNFELKLYALLDDFND
jgi:hypothetical protein